MFNLNFQDNKPKISLNEDIESESYSNCKFEKENSIISSNFLSNENPAFELKQEEKLNPAFEEDLLKKLYFLEVPNAPKEIFKLERKIQEEEIISTNYLIPKRKRGKAKTKDDNRKHNFDSFDNSLRKIQVHFLTFIIAFLNDLLYKLNYKQRFKNLDYKFKRDINKKSLALLKNNSIKKIIIETKISEKYKNDCKYFNKKIYKEIEGNKVLREILSKNCLDLFQKIYFKSDKTIDLEEYGLSQIINLSENVKMFKDLLSKDNQNLTNHNYTKNLYQCVKKNFFPQLKFAVINKI